MASSTENVVDDMKHCYENLILIDASANLTNKKYSRDLDAVVQRAQDSGKILSIDNLIALKWRGAEIDKWDCFIDFDWFNIVQIAIH